MEAKYTYKSENEPIIAYKYENIMVKKILISFIRW
jgi:hypothetical protein